MKNSMLGILFVAIVLSACAYNPVHIILKRIGNKKCMSIKIISNKMAISNEEL
jgi:hypothetical protein